ncbi:MAG: adenylyl-sulfate reductase subunit alpha [Deltaproteobacteria bacterium]|nr:adenylyl-sulfate reductase subunit alpha [Deltaproteobacteria bacterium]
MALPNKPLGEIKALKDPEVEERDVDILIVGGGMAACGTAFEIKKWAKDDDKILLVDKAAMERSGAVAQGLSAINTYIGENTPDDYVRMVRNDLMGIVREDLIFDLGRHVDDSVHLFEEWGLPMWKKSADDKTLNGKKGQKMGTLKSGAKPVRTGKWQIMINGESYKRIVSEAAKLALGEENILERVFIVELLNDANTGQIAGAVGFSVRENKVYVIKCKTMMVACGGAVNIYQPRSVGEGKGRAWYPVWNAGSTYTMALRAGAELSMMENRFTPARFKDGYGPVGAWFLLFKGRLQNALGENYLEYDEVKKELESYAPYGTAAITPTCLRNHVMLFEMKAGRGPIIMDTVTALKNLGETMDKKELKELESEAWEDFLDMTCGQANLWCATNTEPEKKNSEIMPTEPYLLGSHSGCCGIWCCGPDEDWVPDSYKWDYKGKVYNRMTTIPGLFTAGDGVGCSGHKFSSGSHYEGRSAAKQMVRFIRNNEDFTPTLAESTQELVDMVYKPVRTYLENCEYTTATDINPNYIKPAGLTMRLMKATHEYGAGTATYYQTNGKSLEMIMDMFEDMRTDSEKLAAGDLHELLRCWEIYHRLYTVEAHLRHIQFRKETRFPGFYYRADFPGQDDENWFCFVNSTYDKKTNTWSLKKEPYHKIIPDA